MLLPTEVRTSSACHERDAQQQYEPFRTTEFTRRGDAIAASRGPGALFREEWNSLAGNAQRHKALSLYRTERDVNPTPTTTVQRFYNPQESTDVSSQLKRKGNAVAALKSNVPRFHTSSEGNKAAQRGPGSYHPDRYHGAFPALFDKMTPRNVYLEKLEAKRALAATFGIIPAPNLHVGQSPRRDRPVKFRTTKDAGGSTVPRDITDISLETTRLDPALTPRNTYQNPANRQFVLAMRPPDQPRNAGLPR